MSSAQPPTIRHILEAAGDIHSDIDLDDPAEVAELILGDGQGGEGVEYRIGGRTHDLGFTRVRGWWIVEHGYATGEREADNPHREVWDWTFTPYARRAEAEAAYIEAIQAAHAQGVTWEPDVCPIFDRVAATW